MLTASMIIQELKPNTSLYRGGPLYQQYIVDAWASIKQSNLN